MVCSMREMPQGVVMLAAIPRLSNTHGPLHGISTKGAVPMPHFSVWSVPPGSLARRIFAEVYWAMVEPHTPQEGLHRPLISITLEDG